MQAFMLYMSGGGVQIFSMGIVLMLLVSPIKNIAGLNAGALSPPPPPPFLLAFERLTSHVDSLCPLRAY